MKTEVVTTSSSSLCDAVDGYRALEAASAPIPIVSHDWFVIFLAVVIFAYNLNPAQSISQVQHLKDSCTHPA